MDYAILGFLGYATLSFFRLFKIYILQILYLFDILLCTYL